MNTSYVFSSADDYICNSVFDGSDTYSSTVVAIEFAFCKRVRGCHRHFCKCNPTGRFTTFFLGFDYSRGSKSFRK